MLQLARSRCGVARCERWSRASADSAADYQLRHRLRHRLRTGRSASATLWLTTVKPALIRPDKHSHTAEMVRSHTRHNSKTLEAHTVSERRIADSGAHSAKLVRDGSGSGGAHTERRASAVCTPLDIASHEHSLVAHRLTASLLIVTDTATASTSSTPTATTTACRCHSLRLQSSLAFLSTAAFAASFVAFTSSTASSSP